MSSGRRSDTNRFGVNTLGRLASKFARNTRTDPLVWRLAHATWHCSLPLCPCPANNTANICERINIYRPLIYTSVLLRLVSIDDLSPAFRRLVGEVSCYILVCWCSIIYPSLFNNAQLSSSGNKYLVLFVCTKLRMRLAVMHTDVDCSCRIYENGIKDFLCIAAAADYLYSRL